MPDGAQPILRVVVLVRHAAAGHLLHPIRAVVGVAGDVVLGILCLRQQLGGRVIHIAGGLPPLVCHRLQLVPAVRIRRVGLDIRLLRDVGIYLDEIPFLSFAGGVGILLQRAAVFRVGGIPRLPVHALGELTQLRQNTERPAFVFCISL